MFLPFSLRLPSRLLSFLWSDAKYISFALQILYTVSMFIQPDLSNFVCELHHWNLWMWD